MAHHPNRKHSWRPHILSLVLLLLTLLCRRNLLTRAIPPRPHLLRILSLNDNPVDPIPHAKFVVSLNLMALPHLPKRLLRIRRPLMLKARNPSVIPVVVFKCVGFFAVDGIVADFAHLVRHA